MPAILAIWENLEFARIMVVMGICAKPPRQTRPSWKKVLLFKCNCFGNAAAGDKRLFAHPLNRKSATEFTLDCAEVAGIQAGTEFYVAGFPPETGGLAVIVHGQSTLSCHKVIAADRPGLL
jgi:hypothetical protein